MLNIFWETQVWLITSRTNVQYRQKFQNHRNSFHLLSKYLTSQLLTLQGTQKPSSIAAQNAQPILGNSSIANNKQNKCSIPPKISKSCKFG
jgi:hypothetical protein